MRPSYRTADPGPLPALRHVPDRDTRPREPAHRRLHATLEDATEADDVVLAGAAGQEIPRNAGAEVGYGLRGSGASANGALPHGNASRRRLTVNFPGRSPSILTEKKSQPRGAYCRRTGERIPTGLCCTKHRSCASGRWRTPVTGPLHSCLLVVDHPGRTVVRRAGTTLPCTRCVCSPDGLGAALACSGWLCDRRVGRGLSDLAACGGCTSRSLRCGELEGPQVRQGGDWDGTPISVVAGGQ